MQSLDNLFFVHISALSEILEKNFKFSWAGSDEYDPACGFGDFTYNDDILIGRIYFHDGDDSSFLAKKTES